MKSRIEVAYNYARTNGLVRTYGEFAQLLDVEPATLSRWLAGKQKPSDKALRNINRACGYPFSDDWLLTGEGEMLRAGESDISHKPTIDSLLEQVRLKDDLITQQAETIAALKDTIALLRQKQ